MLNFSLQKIVFLFQLKLVELLNSSVKSCVILIIFFFNFQFFSLQPSFMIVSTAFEKIKKLTAPKFVKITPYRVSYVVKNCVHFFSIREKKAVRIKGLVCSERCDCKSFLRCSFVYSEIFFYFFPPLFRHIRTSMVKRKSFFYLVAAFLYASLRNQETHFGITLPLII